VEAIALDITSIQSARSIGILLFIFLAPWTNLDQLGKANRRTHRFFIISFENKPRPSGDGEFASFDKETVDRITSIQQLDQKTKSILFNLIDTYIQNFKMKQAFIK